MPMLATRPHPGAAVRRLSIQVMHKAS